MFKAALGAVATPSPESSAPNDGIKTEDGLYVDLASAADLAWVNLRTLDDCSRRLCKSFVEQDRASTADESNMKSFMYVMDPPSASPKNDIIYACPLDQESAPEPELLPLHELKWWCAIGIHDPAAASEVLWN